MSSYQMDMSGARVRVIVDETHLLVVERLFYTNVTVENFAAN
jgi:hypothetical protein